MAFSVDFKEADFFISNLFFLIDGLNFAFEFISAVFVGHVLRFECGAVNIAAFVVIKCERLLFIRNAVIKD